MLFLYVQCTIYIFYYSLLFFLEKSDLLPTCTINYDGAVLDRSKILSGYRSKDIRKYGMCYVRLL